MIRDSALWRLMRPYWTSQDKWRGLLLLAIGLSTSFLMARIGLLSNQVFGDFFDALAARKVALLTPVLWRIVEILAATLCVQVLGPYFRQMLQIRWRSGLTDWFLSRWMNADAFYRIERDRAGDNPDQRISEDVQLFVQLTLDLGLGFVQILSSFVIFSFVLWNLSGSLDFSLGGRTWYVSGYMFWFAIAYASVSYFVTNLISRKIVDINVRQQAVEADFRFALMQVRENAEQIALYKGAMNEESWLKERFGRIRLNWALIMQYTKRVNLTSQFFGYVGGFAPMLLAVPRYLAGQIPLGAVTRTMGAFGHVSGGILWFVEQYGQLAQWRAVVRRLDGLDRAIEARAASGIVRTSSVELRLGTSALALHRPDGQVMADIGSVSVLPGERWLIKGASGAGKSTLLRSFAGLWPHGQGSVNIPGRASMLFLPQKSYLPAGTLKRALAYPGNESDFSDETCRDALVNCRLESLLPSLHVGDRWAHRLSPGEQQRLAFVRVLLHRPDYLFLDEATSALDHETEAHLYRLILIRLPDTVVVSVAHRASLDEFHTHQLRVGSP